MSYKSTPHDLPEDPSIPQSTTVPPVPPTTEIPAPDPEGQPTPPSQAGSSNVLYGRLLIGLGVIFLGLMNFFPEISYAFRRGDIWRFWPLILVGYGVFKFVEAKGAKQRHGAAWLVATGVVLLIHFVGLFGLDWGTGWPLWIIAAGMIDVAFPEKARDRGMGLFLLALGTFFLLYRTYALPEGWEHGWPILVILLGVVLIWQALFAKRDSSGRGARRREGRDHG